MREVEFLGELFKDFHVPKSCHDPFWNILFIEFYNKITIQYTNEFDLQFTNNQIPLCHKRI